MYSPFIGSWVCLLSKYWKGLTVKCLLRLARDTAGREHAPVLGVSRRQGWVGSSAAAGLGEWGSGGHRREGKPSGSARVVLWLAICRAVGDGGLLGGGMTG